ncbi:NAD(P)-dependent alcohol dehydrogenase [Myxococcus faecalis]|uniref:zinc-dependent alcohol dehydrogenase family protein n=1 Tax=Myxococcus TaxID=32 RepID=UPI001CBDCA34|nr:MULTISPECIES: NAD(P)-dependent alcohol dehydrogenase [Myxococcus]MBZ4401461.1 NAD(P)-dependent alcohol dehydrogenase [Myxococcus sp. AS-1-15]MCK8500142.1 NAD(P)-dependent alcohol dehydrogenase [Myxococcus fulvus]
MKTWELQPRPGFDALTRAERPSQSVGSHEVKVRVRAVSLNYRDLLITRGAEKNLSSPRVPVSDGAGEVLEVGSAVTRWKVGDPVMANFFPHWVDGELSDAHHASALGGSLADGMLREEVVLPEHAWVRIPKGYSFEEAATLPCAGLTAWQALFEVTSLRPGETVLLQGSGGVSVFALQLAKAAGARVLMTSSSADKAVRLRELGAEEVIDYRADAKWGERAKALTGGRGVDLVVDVGGQATFDQSSAALRYGGSMSMLGVLTGARGEVNLGAVFQRRQTVHGVYVGSVSMFERFVAALEHNRIKPVIDRVFPFEEARAAWEHLASAQHLGKVVVSLP